MTYRFGRWGRWNITKWQHEGGFHHMVQDCDGKVSSAEEEILTELRQGNNVELRPAQDRIPWDKNKVLREWP